ncbi:MAG: DUF6363 domain-containing protein [Coprobacillus cateniformis]
MLKATCAIPFAFPVITFNGQDYYDGGICDPIPVKQAKRDGHDKMLIVLTRPKGYQKNLSKANIITSRRLKKRYPHLVKPLLTRHELYNETLNYCEMLEQTGKAVILRPSEDVQIDSFEKDLHKIDAIYHYGYQQAVENIEKIRALLK